MTTGASGTQEVLDPCGATVAGAPGARPTGETFPNFSDRGMSRRQSWLICLKKKKKEKEDKKEKFSATNKFSHNILNT